MKISPKGIRIIIAYEKFIPVPYVCPAGYPTIGYGHRILPDESFTHITETEAEAILKKDVERIEKTIERLVKAEINQEIFDALVSFVYNIGEGNFANSTLLQCLNSNDYYEAIMELAEWIYVKGRILKGLVRRRLEEAMLFSIGAYKLNKL